MKEAFAKREKKQEGDSMDSLTLKIGEKSEVIKSNLKTETWGGGSVRKIGWE